MKFRTISHLFEVFVAPEIQRRISDGRLSLVDLPLEITKFQIIQGVNASNSVVNTVQLNDEVVVVVSTKVTRPVEAGESLSLADIDPERCFIQNPEFEGRPATYFLCQSFLFDYHLIFDCTPAASPDLKDLRGDGNRYPIVEYVNARRYQELVRPAERLREFSVANWPPAPGYFPIAMNAAFENPAIIHTPAFPEKVKEAFSEKYWIERIKFWEQAKFFPGRIDYIKRVVRAHFEHDYVCSTHVLVPQFEGIVKDYLGACNVLIPSRFRECVQELRTIILSRRVLLFSKAVLEEIFAFLDTGTFWRNSQQVNPETMVNRHGIVHGAFTAFESHDISLKYLILLDALAFVILHDRIVSRTL